MERIIRLLRQCTADITGGAASWGLDGQIRAYDLLDLLLAAKEDGTDCSVSEEFRVEAAGFADAYEADASAVDGWYDEAALRAELEKTVIPLKEAVNEARFEAAAAASLHEFAKEVYEIWQTSGIFARRRALRELRERAGFRLESHRIGNYVAKTFDLMNEAQARFAKAQQACFYADVSYKIRPGIYRSIIEAL
mgnify:CR=1 FL=1